ncbi:cobalt/nickel transport system permease protein [Methanolinea mesophila]|uniref:cobalt ECF transporter T component CbiQ n=1 Tax=Methanolinea mesophila TaxID=547055 RepID=UPI001AE80885|nr:cobalt ECF transporter T component CbiQ [Methanolinea mesophila]MBP1928185.1 cobalt/nickel transport system permease protein [Methanolinea mesophila]
MIEELFLIEKQAYRDSFIHRLDARVKIIIAFAAIVAIVAIPYSTMIYRVGAVFFLFFAVLWALARLSPRVYIWRLIMVLPFGIFIIVAQIFFENPHYTVFTPIVDLPFNIHIYAESVEFASILLVKFLVCISFIILLSSTTRMQHLLEGAGRLGLPAEFSLILGMMIRYLFVFAYMYRKVTESLETRCFDPFSREIPWKYRVRMLGYTIGTMFIRAYEQGERTYLSMLCRGYGRESHLFITKKPLPTRDWAFLATGMVIIIAVPVLTWLGISPW